MLNCEDSFCILKAFFFIYPTSVPIDLSVEYHLSRFIVCVNNKAKGFLWEIAQW